MRNTMDINSCMLTTHWGLPERQSRIPVWTSFNLAQQLLLRPVVDTTLRDGALFQKASIVAMQAKIEQISQLRNQ